MIYDLIKPEQKIDLGFFSQAANKWFKKIIKYTKRNNYVILVLDPFFFFVYDIILSLKEIVSWVFN